MFSFCDSVAVVALYTLYTGKLAILGGAGAGNLLSWKPDAEQPLT